MRTKSLATGVAKVIKEGERSIAFGYLPKKAFMTPVLMLNNFSKKQVVSFTITHIKDKLYSWSGDLLVAIDK